MKNRSVRAWVFPAAVMLLAISACQAPPPDAQAACEDAVVSVPDIEQLEGLDLIVSLDFARTLASCATSAEWMTAVRANPESVGAPNLSESDATTYLVAACQLPHNEVVESPACRDAEELGIFTPYP